MKVFYYFCRQNDVLNAMLIAKRKRMRMKSRIIDKRNSDRAGGLYSAEYEHDACGVGMIVNINGDK